MKIQKYYRDMSQKHKKYTIIVGLILGFVLLCVYIHILFLSGVWYEDTFLYEKKDYQFVGSSFQTIYKMEIKPIEDGKELSFAINDVQNQYVMKNEKKDSYVKIYENGTLVLESEVMSIGDYYVLLDDERGLIDIQATLANLNKTHVFPTYSQLYTWSMKEKYDIRGNIIMLPIIFMCFLVLFLDIKFPNLFFVINYRLMVDGGEPSELYRIGQKIGRIILGMTILVCIVLSLTTH